MVLFCFKNAKTNTTVSNNIKEVSTATLRVAINFRTIATQK